MNDRGRTESRFIYAAALASPMTPTPRNITVDLSRDDEWNRGRAMFRGLDADGREYEAPGDMNEHGSFTSPAGMVHVTSVTVPAVVSSSDARFSISRAPLELPVPVQNREQRRAALVHSKRRA